LGFSSPKPYQLTDYQRLTLAAILAGIQRSEYVTSATWTPAQGATLRWVAVTDFTLGVELPSPSLGVER
jgi:hypothetical protein